MSGRVRVYLGCSLDGCIAGPDHDISFLTDYEAPPDCDWGGGLAFDAFLDEIGAILMGRRTYQVLVDFDAWQYRDVPVLVATHRPLPPAPQGGTAWAVAGPIEELIEQAKATAAGKDVYLDGGNLVRQGLDAGLVDELCLTFLPVVLGQGIRLWEGLQRRQDLTFDPPTTFGNGMIQVTARARPRR